MTDFVVDSSVAAKWLIEEPGSERAWELISRAVFLRAPDVIVPELRGRSDAAKGALQAWANIGPALVGGISYLVVHNGFSKAMGLKIGLLSMVPLYLIGRLLALAALRFYPGDLAFVVAHARAKRIAGEMPDQQEEAPPTP